MTIPVNAPVDIVGALATTGAITENGTAVPVSANVTDIVSISQASYDALGAGRPAGRLYLITS